LRSIKKAEGVDSIKKNAICSQFIVSGTKSCRWDEAEVTWVGDIMRSILIADTTKEEREAIIREFMDCGGGCENCSSCYINNGFTLVKEETLECNAKSIGNWTFRMDL